MKVADNTFSTKGEYPLWDKRYRSGENSTQQTIVSLAKYILSI